MTFAELLPGNQFQFPDGKLTRNVYRKTLHEIESIYKWNAFQENNPSVFLWVEGNQNVQIYNRN